MAHVMVRTRHHLATVRTAGRDWETDKTFGPTSNDYKCKPLANFCGTSPDHSHLQIKTVILKSSLEKIALMRCFESCLSVKLRFQTHFNKSRLGFVYQIGAEHLII